MVKEITSKEEFEKLVSPLNEWDFQGDKCIIDFYSPTCMPCKQMFPILEELEYTSYKINCEALPEVASAFGVSSVPQLVFVANKTKEPTTHVGLIPKNKIIEIMETK